MYTIRMRKTFVSILVCTALFATSVAPIVFAATTCDSTKQLCNPIKYDTFSQFVEAVTRTAVNVLLPFVVISFIYTGFLFVKAQGKPTEIQAAQTSLWYSVIGALILFGAWGFANIIGTTVATFTS